MKINTMVLAVALCLGVVVTSYADQLDDEARAKRPDGVMVKVDPKNKIVSFYKLDMIDKDQFKKLDSLSADAKEGGGRSNGKEDCHSRKQGWRNQASRRTRSRDLDSGMLVRWLGTRLGLAAGSSGWSGVNLGVPILLL